VSQLITAGADPTQSDFHDNNAVDLAVQQRPPRCLAVFVANLHSDLLQIADAKGVTALIKAIQKGNIEAVSMLLNSNVEVNVKTGSYGWTPVHWACHADQSDILSLLIRSGADVNVIDVEQKTAGHIAAISQNPDCIKVLIKQCGIETVQVADQQGVTPLMYSCGMGNDQHVKALLKKKVDVSAVDIDGQSALHWCKENQHGRCVDLLCKRHPEILNQPDAHSQTALHHAAIAGNAIICIALCQQSGIQMDCLDNEQHTPVHWASVSGHIDVLMCLAEYGANMSSPDVNGAHPLHYAVQLCSTAVSGGEMNEDMMVRGMECIRVLLDKGCHIDVRDNEERTPLMWAVAADGMSNVCLLLAQHGADVNAHDSLGMTPLHVAVNTFHPTECVTLVSELGADVNAVDHNGHSPLFIAVSQNAVDMVSFLLQSGATPDKQDKDKMSVAHIASSLGYLDCLDLIHSHIGHIDLKNEKGARPLHEASGNGHIDCVEFLLKAGCSVDSSDNDGATSLHFAAARNHVEVCSLLISAKADVNSLVTTDQGVVLTPLDFAEASCAFDAIREIQSAGGVFGRQLDRMDAIKQEKGIKVVGAVDMKPEEKPEGKEQVNETDMTVEGHMGETEIQKFEAVLDSIQEADEESHKPGVKQEEIMKQMLTDVKEDDAASKQPDGKKSLTVTKTANKESLKEEMAENETDSKEEVEAPDGNLDNAEIRDHKESEENEQLETWKLDQGERKEEEKTIIKEDMEMKPPCDTVQEDKQKAEPLMEKATVALAEETKIFPAVEETRDRDYKSTRKPDNDQMTEEKEETTVKVVRQMEITPSLDETVDDKLLSRKDKDKADDMKTPVLNQQPDQTDSAPEEQAAIPGSEAGQLSSHLAAPPPTPPTPSKKRRNWLFKSSTTSPQEQQQTDSPTLKRSFNIRQSSKSDSPSKATGVENPIAYACAYGALISGTVGGTTPQQYIVQQLVTTLPQLRNVTDEKVDNTSVKSDLATVKEEIIVDETDAGIPTESSPVKEKGVEESQAVASPIVVPLSLSDTSESVARKEAVNLELAREAELQENKQMQAMENNLPFGNELKQDLTDAEAARLAVPTADNSALKQETPRPEIDVLGESNTLDVKEMTKSEIPPGDSNLMQLQEQSLMVEQEHLATQSRPTAIEIRKYLESANKPIQQVESDADKTTSPISPQPDRSVSEKSLGSLIDAVAMQVDERLATMLHTGEQVEADEEQEEQRKRNLLSDEEKRLIESLKQDQERPTSAAACAIKELARVRTLHISIQLTGLVQLTVCFVGTCVTV
jgi:ankyrin repeat protein